ADGGTLFLDEITELSPRLQAKLLRVLEDKEIRHIGSNRTKRVDIRVIAATNRNLSESLEKETFRRDLYYRLNTLRILVPSLQERREDIPLLAEFFLQSALEEKGKTGITFTNEALKKLSRHTWPGNIRELKNVIERAACLVEGEHISLDLINFL
ncbi:MAG: sigma 54-interacting transcriptional regulator, partial [Spirochaetales bacterium]